RARGVRPELPRPLGARHDRRRRRPPLLPRGRRLHAGARRPDLARGRAGRARARIRGSLEAHGPPPLPDPRPPRRRAVRLLAPRGEAPAFPVARSREPRVAPPSLGVLRVPDREARLPGGEVLLPPGGPRDPRPRAPLERGVGAGAELPL